MCAAKRQQISCEDSTKQSLQARYVLYSAAEQAARGPPVQGWRLRNPKTLVRFWARPVCKVHCPVLSTLVHEHYSRSRPQSRRSRLSSDRSSSQLRRQLPAQNRLRQRLGSRTGHAKQLQHQAGPVWQRGMRATGQRSHTAARMQRTHTHMQLQVIT